MAYLVLARKWRPQTFEEVVGQQHVTRTLQNAIAAQRVAHGYLFTGPRGCGKTSTARILAKALNCEKGPAPTPCGLCASCTEVSGGSSVDVQEIDGASNNSVEDIRNLREKVLYSGVRDRYKVYIIDEVHMLSGAAFNALLKTLEEPPPHVIFIFATTEAQKIPQTILSRTQRFDFRRVSHQDLSHQLKKILDAEGIPSTPEALSLISKAAGGSVRDSQTLLDQVISYAGGQDGKPKAVTPEDVLQVIGGVQESEALAALKAAIRGDLGISFEWVSRLYDSGADLRLAVGVLGELLRGLLLAKNAGAKASSAELLPETMASLVPLSKEFSLSRLLRWLRSAGEADSQLRFSGNPRLILEILFTKMRPVEGQASLGELFEELGEMEKRIKAIPSAGISPLALVPETVPTGVDTARPAGGEAAAIVAVEAPPAPENDLELVRGAWERIRGRAGQHSAMLSTALNDCDLVDLANGKLILKPRNGFSRDALKEEGNVRAVEQAVENETGKTVLLELAAEPIIVARQTGSGPDPEDIARVRQENPGVKSLEEAFDAVVVDIKDN